MPYWSASMNGRHMCTLQSHLPQDYHADGMCKNAHWSSQCMGQEMFEERSTLLGPSMVPHETYWFYITSGNWGLHLTIDESMFFPKDVLCISSCICSAISDIADIINEATAILYCVPSTILQWNCVFQPNSTPLTLLFSHNTYMAMLYMCRCTLLFLYWIGVMSCTKGKSQA